MNEEYEFELRVSHDIARKLIERFGAKDEGHGVHYLFSNGFEPKITFLTVRACIEFFSICELTTVVEAIRQMKQG